MYGFRRLVAWVVLVASLVSCATKAQETPDAGGADASGDARIHFAGTLIPPGSGVLPINLAGGSGVVTGVLPTGNQASQSMSGDVTGTTASSTVAAISGSSPINVAPAVFNWTNSSAAPEFEEATTSNSTCQPFTIQPQQSTNGTAQTGGAFVVNLQAAGGTGNETAVDINRGGSTVLALGPLGAAQGAIWGGGVTGASNFGFFQQSGLTELNTNSGGSIALDVANSTAILLGTSTSANFYSGATIINSWAGTNNGQLQNIQYFPVVCQTTTATATTCYTWSNASLTSAHAVVLKADVGFGSGSGSNGGACSCVAEFANVSGTLNQGGTTQSPYTVNAAACSYTISGTSVILKVTSSVSGTNNWQGVLMANLL